MDRDPEVNRPGWDVVLGVLAVHGLLSVQALALGPRRAPAAGDPMTGLGSVFFLFWGLICLLAPRYEARSLLFRFLNGRNNATMVGAIFIGMSVWLFGEWVW